MLYIELADVANTVSEEIGPGIVLDFDEHNRVAGIKLKTRGNGLVCRVWQSFRCLFLVSFSVRKRLQKHNTLRYCAFTALFVALFFRIASACDTGTVRDAAFHAKRDNYRLVVVTPPAAENAEASKAALEAWFVEQRLALNVRLDWVESGDPAALVEYGIQSSAEDLPTAWLCGWHPVRRAPYAAYHWPGIPSEDALEALRATPSLAKARKALLDHWAVLIFARGEGPDRAPVVTQVARNWAEQHPPGIAVVHLDRHDPREALFCAIAGVLSDSPDWAGIVYGKGKLLLPTLTGDDISVEHLDGLLQRLPVPCTCLQQAMAPGLDLPLHWDSALDAGYTALTGTAGYTEISLDQKVAPLMADLPPDDARIGVVVLLPLALLGALAIASVAAMIIRLRRSP